MYELILSNVAKHISLTKQEQTYFTRVLRSASISKKNFILQEGQRCTSINFVTTGIARAYFLNEAGKESTIMFALPGWWITDMHCFVHQQPAILNIQVVKDCKMLQLHKNDLEELYDRVPKFERFFRVLMQNAYIREQLRVVQNLSLPAEERYDNFLAKYPQLAESITQKQIASYLGITPEFLSAIRGKHR